MVPILSHILVLAVYCVIDSAQTVFYPESCGEELAMRKKLSHFKPGVHVLGEQPFVISANHVRTKP